MGNRFKRPRRDPRRGAMLILAALLMTLMLGMIAFAVDVGCIVLVRTQLQASADSAAMAAASSMGKSRDEMLEAASKYAGFHEAGGRPVKLNPDDVQYGIWDASTRRFAPSATMGNAIRVTARTDETTGGESPLFFGKIFGHATFTRTASAVAMANPRDIAFVVDLSGSMNDDSEPCWATGEINKTFGPEGYPTVGNELMQKLYDDFGFGSYPGTTQYIGGRFGVPADQWAYAELTEDNGPLAERSIPDRYRIERRDSESVRKQKAYSAIIDYQIRQAMPAAKPTPDSSSNYSYWEKYLDYIIQSVYLRDGRGRIPPDQDGDRIYGFNNPNRTTFPAASSSVPSSFRNLIGYVTYTQFMVDHGRDLKPDGRQYSPLSQDSGDCPRHWEQTRGGNFEFPPRTQPMHAARRALIAAMQVVKQRNQSIGDPSQRDWVSVITFDTISGGGPVIEQPLTGDYDEAMKACTGLQAVGDKSALTATEAGLIAARDHIRSRNEGGQGRLATNKIVVLLTDGVPNLYVSDREVIDQAIKDSDNPDFFGGGGSYAYNAPLMQAMQMQADNWYVFPVGVGLGTNYGFMDRLSRMGGTANDDGQSARGSGNPAEYEQRLTDIFEEIITNPRVRLVQ